MLPQPLTSRPALTPRRTSDGAGAGAVAAGAAAVPRAPPAGLPTVPLTGVCGELRGAPRGVSGIVEGMRGVDRRLGDGLRGGGGMGGSGASGMGGSGGDVDGGGGGGGGVRSGSGRLNADVEQWLKSLEPSPPNEKKRPQAERKRELPKGRSMVNLFGAAAGAK